MPSLLAALKKKFPNKKFSKKRIRQNKGKYANAGVKDGTAYFSNDQEILLILSEDNVSKEAIEALIDTIFETIKEC